MPNLALELTACDRPLHRQTCHDTAPPLSQNLVLFYIHPPLCLNLVLFYIHPPLCLNLVLFYTKWMYVMRE